MAHCYNRTQAAAYTSQLLMNGSPWCVLCVCVRVGARDLRMGAPAQLQREALHEVDCEAFCAALGVKIFNFQKRLRTNFTAADSS